jgi:hypothetical protein
LATFFCIGNLLFKHDLSRSNGTHKIKRYKCPPRPGQCAKELIPRKIPLASSVKKKKKKKKKNEKGKGMSGDIRSELEKLN